MPSDITTVVFPVWGDGDLMFHGVPVFRIQPALCDYDLGPEPIGAIEETPSERFGRLNDCEMLPCAGDHVYGVDDLCK